MNIKDIAWTQNDDDKEEQHDDNKQLEFLEKIAL